LPLAARTEIARDSSAHRQVNVLPLVTFLGRARKVTRLPAGTGEVEVYPAFRLDSTAKPAGRVPPDALLFVQANKKQAKNGFTWRWALLSHRFSGSSDRWRK
jgi:hypothetical protein